MPSYNQLWSLRRTLVAIVCYIGPAAAANSILYCSGVNTGSDFSAVYYQWQSYGECHDTCTLDNNYALSIIQGNNCWCSNYAPAVTTDKSNCNKGCPGYPDDICGGDDLFVYYQMNKAVSGTKGSGTKPTNSQISVTQDPPPLQTEPVNVTSTGAGSESSSSSSSNSNKPPGGTSPPGGQTWVPTPSVSIVTDGQSIRYITITPTAPPASADGGSQSKKSGGLGTGPAVGLAIGLIALFALIGVAVFWFLRKKKHDEYEEEARRIEQDSKRSSTSGLRTDMTRTMSQHSRFVLGSNGQTVVGGFEPAMVEGSGSSRVSGHGMKPVDPRLDPFGVAYGNRSRESLNTINDGHDYTRKILRTTNPDPDHDN